MAVAMLGRWLVPLAWLGAGSSEVPLRQHRAPVVGIVASPLKLPGASAAHGFSWIWKTYVDSLHDAGAEVVPLIPHVGLPAFRKALENLDAVLLTGGEDDAGVHGSQYPDLMMDAMKAVYEHIAAKGDMPLWGTCQGFQALCVMAADDPSVIVPTYGTLDTDVPLEFTAEAGTSRLLRHAPPSVLAELGRRNSTLNFHSYGVLESSFQAGRVKGFRLLATDHDTQGQAFAALMEHSELPVFASQFHPELYHFLVGGMLPTNQPMLKAIAANQYLMNFFVDQATQYVMSGQGGAAATAAARIGSYPLSFPPLAIFGAASGDLQGFGALEGYVFNGTTPMTASELADAVARLKDVPPELPGWLPLLGPISGPWLARALVVLVAAVTATLLAFKLLQRKLPSGASAPLLEKDPVAP